jgi:hypothetical protein
MEEGVWFLFRFRLPRLALARFRFPRNCGVTLLRPRCPAFESKYLQSELKHVRRNSVTIPFGYYTAWRSFDTSIRSMCVL